MIDYFAIDKYWEQLTTDKSKHLFRAWLWEQSKLYQDSALIRKFASIERNWKPGYRYNYGQFVEAAQKSKVVQPLAYPMQYCSALPDAYPCLAISYVGHPIELLNPDAPVLIEFPTFMLLSECCQIGINHLTNEQIITWLKRRIRYEKRTAALSSPITPDHDHCNGNSAVCAHS